MTEDSAGQCLCGSVRYRISGRLPDVVTCHCQQCRRTSGHYVAATRVPLAAFTLTHAETLTWYRSSETAKRGFCSRCGANLFWQADDAATISVYAGSLDTPTGLTTAAHIYTDFKGDYYDLPRDAPRFPAWD